jgi:UDP-3-O-[3-hydroxymyristoyl] glucosamine N-acyltransferase
MPEITLGEIAERARGELQGDADRVIRGVASVDAAAGDELCFVTHGRYLPRLSESRAGAVLLPRSLGGAPAGSPHVIQVDDPYVVLTWLLPLLYPATPAPPGVHGTALVDETASVGADVGIEPYVVIGRNVTIGSGSRIGAHTVIEEGCSVGDGSVIHPHVRISGGATLGRNCVVHSGARIGGEGFRFVHTGGAHRKVLHIGGCRIGDDVEIGANTTIDRGVMEDTVVGDGTKIDNLVQIGHNSRIGRQVLLVAQVGLSGSTVIEDGAVLGGQAGVVGHLTIGARARVGGRAVVTADVPPGTTVSGYPARPHREAMRAQAALFRLPSLFRKLQELEQAVLGNRKKNS